MNLPPPPPQYDTADQQNVRKQLRLADAENFKRGQNIPLQRGEKLYLKSPNGKLFYLQVSNAGVLSTST